MNLVKEEQDGQPQPNMQQNDAFLADKLSGTGELVFIGASLEETLSFF